MNIDDCRIKTNDKLGGGLESNGAATTKSRANAGFERPWMRDSEILEAKKQEATDRVKLAETLGRYPSNVILTHTEDCYIDGGSEQIPNWICCDTCPVRHLDSLSGTLTSGSNNVKSSSSKDVHGNRGSSYGKESSPEGSIMISYGDSGEASRFFYHNYVSDREEYLKTLMQRP